MEHLIVEKISSYIEDNLDKDLSLEDIAKKFHYSKYHINRAFSESKGCTIYKYIQTCRLKEAARKLAETDEPIVEIAYDAHYGSQPAFTQAFRQVYFCTPQVYRKNAVMESRRSWVEMQVQMALSMHSRILLGYVMHGIGKGGMSA